MKRYIKSLSRILAEEPAGVLHCSSSLDREISRGSTHPESSRLEATLTRQVSALHARPLPNLLGQPFGNIVLGNDEITLQVAGSDSNEKTIQR